MSLQPARVRHHPADMVAAAWLTKARAVLAERHYRRGARRGTIVSAVVARIAVRRCVPGRRSAPGCCSRAATAGDGVGWGAVDHLFDVDVVHMPAEMSMETAVPIDFQEAWAKAQRCVNERVAAAVEADGPMVLDRALKWKYMLPQWLLRAPTRGGRRRRQTLAWHFGSFAERRMTELVRSWDDARIEAFFAGHARQRRTGADLFAALLVGTPDTVVALVEDGELSRAAGRLSSKGMGDLSDPTILAQLRDKHPSRSHPIPDAAYDIPIDEAALTVDRRVPYQQLKQHVAAGPSGMRNESLARWFNRLFASARLVTPVKKLGEDGGPDVRPVAVGEAKRRAAERAVVDKMKEAYVSAYELAPSQLGVGISAGDSMLIHGVRLIAEKLGPHGAAPFNATDGYLVGLPEHVWPALHAFRTCIKASVGLEVRFDKMHAYIADMEAARREAPADIEWPELDGHHGIPALNLPLGSPKYVPAYMRGKAEELREEVDASLSKLLSAKLNRRYAAAVREAWGRLQAATAGHLIDADARVTERGAEAASGSQKELTAFLDHANNSRLRNEVCALPATCRERILFNRLDAASGMWTVAIPTERTVMTLHELREVAAEYFFLPGSCLAPVVGSQIILPSTQHNPVTADLYGDALTNLKAPGDAH
eukprot:jgi/Tetstr1/433373/TSEL_022658.t1